MSKQFGIAYLTEGERRERDRVRSLRNYYKNREQRLAYNREWQKNQPRYLCIDCGLMHIVGKPCRTGPRWKTCVVCGDDFYTYNYARQILCGKPMCEKIRKHNLRCIREGRPQHAIRAGSAT